MKVAKVITTCFIKRTFRSKTYLVGDPLGYFGHSQVLRSANDVLKLIKYSIAVERKTDPGVKKRDIIIINNDVGFQEGNSFLKKISGLKIPYGKIITHTRKNSGMSFGAYNYAFKKFKNKYDYFLFAEDDNIISKKNYFKIGIDLFNSEKKAGFLAFIHSTRVGKKYYKPLKLNKKNAISAHSASGLSSTQILNKVYKKYGELPHYKGNDYQKCITYGEVGFPNSFIKIGYKLIDLPKNLVLSIPAYDLKNQIKYKKWPNNVEIFYHYFKFYLYKVFSISSFSLNLYLKILSKSKKIFRLND